jgi:DNA-binding CsgD family transcriptional regulator
MPATSEDGERLGCEREAQPWSYPLERGAQMGSAAAALTLETAPVLTGPALAPTGGGLTIDLRGSLARLVDEGARVPPAVRAPIGASWERSVAAGLRPDRLEVPFDPDIDSEGLLVRVARPVLDQLAGDLAGTGVGIVLTNDRGQVLDRRVTEPWLAARLDRVQLAPGYVYAEDAVGTNGIGTALAERSPATVEGDEHFADALTAVACAAAPIADPGSGRTIGALDLTCLVAHASPLMLPVATRAARDIEERLMDDTGPRERIILQQFLQKRRGAKGPFVLVTERGMVTNAAADRLVDPADEPVLRQAASRLRGGERNTGVTLELIRGDTVSLEVDAPLDGGSADGIVLRLTPVAGPGNAARREDAATTGWDSLTDTERSVAELVAQGLTNREAAERLFLSRHTVGFHLRSIFRKFGTRSRVELARLFVDGRHADFLTGSRSSVDAAVRTVGP